MITVVIHGGLGNQLFQYAYGRALIELGKEVVFDVSFFDTNTQYSKRLYLLDKFLFAKTIKTTKVSKKQPFLTRLRNTIDIDRRNRYIPIVKNADDYIAKGFYSSEQYFLHIREILLKEIVLVEKSDLYKEWEQKILLAKKPLIVHARRTDFLTTGFVNLGDDYYTEALKYFDDDCDIFAFSDDIEWLRNILRKNVICVSGQGLADEEEMMLMSLGKNFITANSTFSWWGAWLSQHNDKKVIAPKNWFKSPLWYRTNKDIIPASWIRI